MSSNSDASDILDEILEDSKKPTSTPEPQPESTPEPQPERRSNLKQNRQKNHLVQKKNLHEN